jgi:hypothetical protein
MADITPTFYSLKNIPVRNGLRAGDINVIIYDLYLAIYAFCNNSDFDAGTIGGDFESLITTPLYAAGTGSQMPLGAADSTVGNYYTPSNPMKPDGMLLADIYTAIYDISVALLAICVKLDADAGSSLDTNFRALISTPLTTTLGSMLIAPAEGLISGTYFYGMESFMQDGCFTQGDLHKCLYNLYQAIVQICTVFDAGAGTLPQTLMAGVGTPLNTAIGQFIITPAGS